MEGRALYASEVEEYNDLDVVFISNGVKLVRKFASPFEANKFVNKCNKSKNITLVRFPPPERR